MVQAAYIHFNGMRVGAVYWDGALGLFEYAPTFLKSGIELAPLTMPLSNAKGKVFSFPQNGNSTTFKGLPGLLADVLPDKYGHTLINAWLARNGRPINSLNPVELLCFIGKRGMGALEFEPTSTLNARGATAIELSDLIAFAEGILSGKKKITARLSKHNASLLQEVLKVGTSAGGARAKAVVAYNPSTRAIKSGQSEAPPGYSHWLLKFDGVTDQQLGVVNGYGRVEMAYYKMATRVGIHMMPSQLLEENGRAHFMTRRFDRADDGTKFHVQTFCAMRHLDFNNILDYSYEMLFETMRLLRLPYAAAEQLYRRMVFNVLLRNCDDHTKNFAFILNASHQWQLAPAYDLCHAYRPGSSWVSQHALSINGKRNHITQRDLEELAAKMNIRNARHIVSEIQEVALQWKRFAKETGVNKELVTSIQKTLPVLKKQ
jgi:serine/threonine-protein kinase HipA